MYKMSKKNKQKERSGENFYDDEAAEEAVEEIIEDNLVKPAKNTAWLAGGLQKDKIIQKMLKYANEFGVNTASSDDVVGEFVRGHECMTYLKKFTE